MAFITIARYKIYGGVTINPLDIKEGLSWGTCAFFIRSMFSGLLKGHLEPIGMNYKVNQLLFGLDKSLSPNKPVTMAMERHDQGGSNRGSKQGESGSEALVPTSTKSGSVVTKSGSRPLLPLSSSAGPSNPNSFGPWHQQGPRVSRSIQQAYDSSQSSSSQPSTGTQNTGQITNVGGPVSSAHLIPKILM